MKAAICKKSGTFVRLPLFEFVRLPAGTHGVTPKNSVKCTWCNFNASFRNPLANSPSKISNWMSKKWCQQSADIRWLMSSQSNFSLWHFCPLYSNLRTIKKHEKNIPVKFERCGWEVGKVRVRKIFPFEVILVSFHAIKIYFLCVVREHTFLFILCSSCSGLDYATHIRVWLPKITMIPPFKSCAFYPKKSSILAAAPKFEQCQKDLCSHDFKLFDQIDR